MSKYKFRLFFFFPVCAVLVFVWQEEFAKAQSQWEKYAGNPVLWPDPQSGIQAFSDPTLFSDGEILQLWISGGGFIPRNPIAGVRTYYFFSADGFSWQSHLANPVFREGAAGDWDSGHIETPSLIRNSDDLWLYYAATPDSLANEGSQLKFGLATSPNGENLVRHPANPILERGAPASWEGRWIESPCVLKTDSLFYMWYNGVDIWWRIRVGLATSTDGINWQKYSGNPVFSPSPGSAWDSVGVYAPQVRWLRNRFVMLYTGLVFSQSGYDFANTKTGLAVSDDGFHWIKASDQPVLTGTPDGWDASGPFTLDWLETKDQLRLVYVSGGKVGVASAPIDVAPVELTENKLSAELVLLQNYPNPFNAETAITYHLPQALEVEIYIFNLQGQKVNTLVKSIRPAGLQKINWQGTDETGLRVAGGVYLCQLKSALFVRTKKMLLLP